MTHVGFTVDSLAIDSSSNFFAPYVRAAKKNVQATPTAVKK
jgi:hypothetical protein